MPVLAAALAIGVAAPALAASPVDVARDHVRSHAKRFDARAADVAGLSVLSSSRTAATGVTHVNLAQRVQGFDVFGSSVTVNVGRDGRVMHASGDLIEGLRPGPATARLEASEAAAAAAPALDLRDYSVAPDQSKLGWHARKDGALRLAWRVQLDAASGMWSATVDARTGALLASEDLMIRDDVDELAGLARRSISANFAPPVFVLSTPNPVNDGSSYRVIAYPTESFNDADRTVVTNPADDTSSPFGWHDTDGVAGAEFTTTQGNNAHAYMDQDNNNQPDFDSSPDGGAGLDFDFPLDPTEHAQTYRSAATTNLFYANNMIHDLLHRYGFDEPSGNFQANNYGRGGTGGDYVRAEAADGSSTNNAMFGTPVNDGGTPRMQMYLWPGNQFGPQNAVTVNGTTYGATWARFTPSPTKAGLTGAFVYGGTGCMANLYAAELPAGDWIAVVDGGTGQAQCPYLTRVEVAQALGAKAVVVAHNTGGNAPILTGSMTGPPVSIPAVAVTQADGAAIKAAIAAGPATGGVAQHPNHPGIRDGDVENLIITHEYGHGLSSRLTGGVGNSCLGGNEQAGEGWSEYLAITLLLDPLLDDPEQPRGSGLWLLFQPNRNANGIRPRPYSRNMAIQPFTYDSIKTGGWLDGTSLALPHGLGHGWAAVLWDLNWDLIDKYGFNRNLYAAWNTGGNNRALQYVVDGLKFQGCNPGLVAARDGILAAAEARNNGPTDTCTVWATFARRGLGYSAVQGTTNRNDNSEAFDTHPDCRRSFIGIPSGQAITDVAAGQPVPLRFAADDGSRGLDIATKNNPYTRQIDCLTRETVTPGQEAITPRPIPVPAVTASGQSLSVDDNGVYTYPWLTDAAWVNTCREFVFTTKTGVQHRAFFHFWPTADVGGTVPPTLSLTLGGPATFGPFTPGVGADYDASTTANVISSAGSALLSIADPSPTATGRLVNGEFALASPVQARATSAGGTGAALADVGSSANPTPLLTYAGPIANDTVTLAFRQQIAANEGLRTGSYSKTLTLTLSTTEP
ncbi:MAG TPA: M36 family metallopeptidase [Solirubrobacter sp.]|nr:M36 family metallopeptidase [Solirubrobacter sp.]